MVKLVAAPGTAASTFETALKAITFENTGNDPTDKGTNLSRSISVVVNDGNADSNVATATVTVTDVNDAPAGGNLTVTGIEDTFRLIGVADLGFSDSDGTLGTVTISSTTGGRLYFDTDGTAGAGDPVEVIGGAGTYTAQDLADGKVSFKPNPDANGAGTGKVTFTVTDNGGAASASSNTLTIDVTPVNDTPLLFLNASGNATEQTASQSIFTATLIEPDLGAGSINNFAGSKITVTRDAASNSEDVFTFVSVGSPDIFFDGSNIKNDAGFIFGTISTNANGVLVIDFTSLETPATVTLVDRVFRAIRYTNTSDNPPASIQMAVTFNDGSPGGGQGTGATGTVTKLLPVNIAAVNDAPAMDLNGPGGGGFNAVLNFSESFTPAQLAPNATVSDVDSTNFDGGGLAVVVTTNAAPEDFLVINDQGPGAGQIGLVAGGITYGGVTFATWGYGGGSGQLNISFNANATPEAVEALVRQIGYFTNSDTPTTAPRGVLFSLTDGDGGTVNRTVTVNVTAVDDPAVAENDAVSTPENAIGTGSLFDNHGSGNDFDPENNPFAITKVTVSGVDYAPGALITLPSGATLQVNADGSYTFDPKGKFNTLTDNTSGAVNTSALGVAFTYTVTGGDTAAVTVTVNGVAGLGDELHGDSGDNIINGTPNSDVFILTQGGNDTAKGKESNDLFIFRAAMTSQDKVDGGDGRDQIAIQGNYTGGNALTLGTGVINVESFVLVPGNNTNRGDPGTNSYSYSVTTVQENVAAGEVMTFDGAQLRVGENFTFRGGAETNGSYRVIGGLGVDDFVGGSQSDAFLFNDGAFGSSDVVDGGAGTARDQLALRGDYTVFFGANQLTSIESLVLLSGHDTPQNTDYDYWIVMNDGNLLGGSMTVDAAQLRSDETFLFFGNSEANGTFKVSGGAGDDMILGGKGADRIRGNAGNDNIYGYEGADELTGGAGDDRFAYDFTSHSTAAASDTITDFTTGDMIALNTIDAIAGGADDAFTFIGSSAFTLGVAGQLRVYEDSGQAGHWFVEADVNGDAQADLVIQVYTTDLQPLDGSDFVL
ncbi:MAG TPA: Ig-like domain-containing protein, partial [Allosphingosinicella sp.]|jgi:hypothetical protein